jgi:hypothetical protein
VAQQIYGLHVEVLDADSPAGVIDVIYVSSDKTVGPADIAIGTLVEAVVQGYMPNGQLRLSMRAEDLARARPPQSL